MGHTKERLVLEKRKEPKPNFIANNYLKVLVDDETITLK
jgi:hypothetical protein